MKYRMLKEAALRELNEDDLKYGAFANDPDDISAMMDDEVKDLGLTRFAPSEDVPYSDEGRQYQGGASEDGWMTGEEVAIFKELAQSVWKAAGEAWTKLRESGIDEHKAESMVKARLDKFSAWWGIFEKYPYDPGRYERMGYSS